MKSNNFSFFAAVLAVVMMTLTAQAQKQAYKADLATSFLRGDVRKVTNVTTETVIEYDRNGYITSKKVKGKEVPYKVVERDAYGHPLKIVNTSELFGDVVSEYTYSPAGLPVRLTVSLPSGTLFSNRVYLYDVDKKTDIVVPVGYVELDADEEMPKYFNPDKIVLHYEPVSFDEAGNMTCMRIFGDFIDTKEEYIIEYYK